MIDALIGVVIAALMIAIVLTTLRISQHQLRQAEDTYAARRLLESLMETTPRRVGQYEGRKPAFSYVVEVREAGETAKLCTLTATVTSLTRRRAWQLEGVRTCAREAQ